MTASIGEIEDAVVAQLSSITGLRAYHFLPDSFTPPCAVVGVGEVDYHGAFGNGDIVHDTSVLVIVARSSDRAGQQLLDDFRSYATSNSIRAAIESDPTLGGVVSTSIVEKSTPQTAISINGAEYLAAQFTLSVHA